MLVSVCVGVEFPQAQGSNNLRVQGSMDGYFVFGSHARQDHKPQPVSKMIKNNAMYRPWLSVTSMKCLLVWGGPKVANIKVFEDDRWNPSHFGHFVFRMRRMIKTCSKADLVKKNVSLSILGYFDGMLALKQWLRKA